MPRRRVDVAVIGAGYWGRNVIRVVDSLEHARLVTVCDRSPERLGALTTHHQAIGTTAVDDVLARPDVSAVFVVTPAASHFDVARRCLMAGKHVYVEKPLATTREDARRLVELAAKQGLILMVGHLFIYEPATAKLVELARSGSIGALRYAYGQRISMSGTARLDTNIIWDALIHDAYIQPELFGRTPARVLVAGGAYLKNGIEDVAFATFDFGEGQVSHCTVSWYALQKTRTLTVVGSEGMLAYDGLSAQPLMRYRRRYVPSEERDPEGSPYWRWVDDDGEVIPIDIHEPLRAECAHFLDCVLDGVPPRTDGRTGLQAVEIIESCVRSAREGGLWQPIGGDVGGG